MQALVYSIFLSVFFSDLLSRLGYVPRFITWSTEVLSIIAVLAIVLFAVRKKEIAIGASYWLLMLLSGLHILFGIIINQVPEGAIISGIRENFKYLPFFFLPTVYAFSQKQVVNLLKFLLVLSLLQFPISLYQRFILWAGVSSGDVVKGSFSTGGHQSIFLVCSISVLLAFYLRGKFSVRTFAILVVLVGAPTMFNETKATVFMLPFALGIPLLAMGLTREKFKRIAIVGFLGIGFYISFFSVYQHYYGQKSEGVVDQFDFFTEGGRFEEYLAPNTSGISTARMGKVDRIILTFRELSKDPINLMFGLGIGNMSESFFGKQFSGAYLDEYGELRGAMISRNLWEFGLIGLVFMFVGLLLVLRDSLMLKAREDVIGIFSHGWVGVLCVIVLALPYRDFMRDDVIAYVFVFLCGLIVSHSARQKYHSEKAMAKELYQV